MFVFFKYLKYIVNYGKISYNLIKLYFNNNLIKDDNYIENLINIISDNGCMLVKCIQWSIPKYKMMYDDNDIIKKLEVFYDKCKIHKTSYTEELYELEFKKSIYDDYFINDLIGSGSIGQVYCVTNKKDNKKYAMKVIHPEVHYDFYIFKIFFLLFYNIILYKYNLVNDINTFIDDIENQLDYKKEGFNCEKMYNLYKDTKYINIPKVYSSTKNIIIMSYLDMNSVDKIDEEKQFYNTYKSLILLIIFINNCCYNEFSHGDLHRGNWCMNYKEYNYINIVDLGFCFKILKEDFLKIDFYVNRPNNLNRIKNILNYLIINHNNNNNKLDINDISNELYNKVKKCKILEIHIKELLKICSKYNIKINSSIFNTLFLFYQLSSIFEYIYSENDGSRKNNNNIENNLSLEIINYCDTYNICKEYKEYLSDTVTKITEFKTSNSKFEKYKDLCLN